MLLSDFFLISLCEKEQPAPIKGCNISQVPYTKEQKKENNIVSLHEMDCIIERGVHSSIGLAVITHGKVCSSTGCH